MKRIFKFVFLLLLLVAGIAAWIFLAPGTNFSPAKEFLYIRTDAANKKAVLDSIEKNGIVSNTAAFNFLASRLGYWENIRPGKYEISKGSSLLSIVRMLRNGRQAAVNLVITKLRTKEDFARFTGNRFQFDSSEMIAFLNEKDSLTKFDADTVTALWRVLPDTYTYTWNSSPSAVYQKLYNASAKFWNEERKAKAKAIRLTPQQVYILASIIEEETTNNNEKDTIASVYLNRLKIGMPLQADPTLKFAVRNFALKRIAGDILNIVSPYNSYKNKGLPPGPICTPSKITIDAVLNPATTSYLYFVANSQLRGHLFSTSFDEHVKKANNYRDEDRIRLRRDSLKKGLK